MCRSPRAGRAHPAGWEHRLARAGTGVLRCRGAHSAARSNSQNQRRLIFVTETFVQSTDDVVKFLKGQHNLINDMFDEGLHASGPKARKKALIDRRQLLAVHETAEEMVVHPRARRE